MKKILKIIVVFLVILLSFFSIFSILDIAFNIDKICSLHADNRISNDEKTLMTSSLKKELFFPIVLLSICIIQAIFILRKTKFLHIIKNGIEKLKSAKKDRQNLKRQKQKQKLQEKLDKLKEE